jgi:hypothetical protein
MKRWYCEYKNGIRIHDYISIMINNFPILVFRKLDNPHDESGYKIWMLGIFGMTKSWFKQYDE